MPRLVSRQKSIPNGFKFVQPEIRWVAPNYATFETVVQGLMAARTSNPDKVRQFGWATDHDGVANDVDAYNAKLCEAMGWKDYITGGAGTTPFNQPSQGLTLRGQSSRLVAGAKTLAEMFGPAGPVDKALAESRAAVCAKCPLNLKGDWTRFFTVPASNAIRAMLGLIKDANLETPHDAALMLCDACGCPCKTKVWARLDHILKHLPEESKAALHPDCWIRKES
jgi:hypothetical protein